MAAGSLLSLAAIQNASAEPVVLRVHHFLPPTSSAHVKLIQPWCDKVAKESANDITCQIYPAMQLGGTPPQLFDQVRDGVADVIWTVPTYAAGRFSKSEVFELPWMAASAKSGSQALWDYVDKNAQDEFKGVHRIFMHVHDGALFHFTKAQPKTLEEMAGLKVRAATRANSRMLEALGATPVQMPLPAVPESLAKGVVDGAAVPWEGTPAIKLSEIAKYHLNVADGMPRISNTIFLFGMNQAKYDSLTPEQKKVIDANSGREASAWAGETGFDAVVAQYKKAAEDLGGTFYDLPEAEYQRWIEATKPVEQGWIDDVTAKGSDGKALIAEARALIKQYAQ
jgi:TRAP-type C4-dicarboxylate transport system substrate-binding protein